MKSVDRIVKIAERFAKKIAQEIAEDPKAVVVDAFLGPREEANFQQFILNPNSHFSQILPESVKKVDIGAVVDAKNKLAMFVVTTTPPVPTQLHTALINALKEDYKAKYGKYPQERFSERLATGNIQPPNVHQSYPSFIQVT